MTQPKFAPIETADEVRPSYDLETAPPWVAHRPSEYLHATRPSRAGRGTPGPDQGYALKLAHLFDERLELEDGEHHEDAMSAGLTIGLRRAGQFGRAPIAADIELGLTLFGFLGGAPADLIAARKKIVAGLPHDYRGQRELATGIPSSTIAMKPIEAKTRLSEWKELLGLAATNVGA